MPHKRATMSKKALWLAKTWKRTAMLCKQPCWHSQRISLALSSRIAVIVAAIRNLWTANKVEIALFYSEEGEYCG